ncbi:uncharacterized protein P884DRAFT_264227 [Thermothelomyces heterothallicus CBS 202.75]|uniref:uncharacterized protein n=1 Tax=Thermothelomyces heterothallicus CBS 202.75 TaxID=1149848 RepID=UPI003742E3BD
MLYCYETTTLCLLTILGAGFEFLAHCDELLPRGWFTIFPISIKNCKYAIVSRLERRHFNAPDHKARLMSG